MGEIRHHQLVPIDATEEERAAALDDFGRLYSELRENGEDPVVGVEATPDGDLYVIVLDEPVAA